MSRSEYNHAEAFCLMLYRSDDGAEAEILWNSRDGVTPFVISSQSGKAMQHVDWHLDQRAPNYIPNVGDRIFIDLTLEKSFEYAARQVDKYWEDAKYPMCERYENKGQAIDLLAKNMCGWDGFRPEGQPDVIEVTQEWLDEYTRTSKLVTVFSGNENGQQMVIDVLPTEDFIRDKLSNGWSATLVLMPQSEYRQYVATIESAEFFHQLKEKEL